MVTQTPSGNQGLTKFTTSGFDLYDAQPSFVCNIQRVSTSEPTKGGVVVGTSPNGAKWRNGYLHGLNSGEDEYNLWADGTNGGAPFLYENCSNFTVEKLWVDGHTWDPIRPGSNTLNPVIDSCRFEDVRDECIEADHVAGSVYVTVRDCLMRNVHTMISMRRGAESTGPTPTHRVDFIRVRASLAGWRTDQTPISGYDRHKDSRDKRMYAWNNTVHGSGQPWKFEGNMTNGTLLVKDCIFMMPNLGKTGLSTMRLIPTNATLHASSGGNVLVWLGSQTSAGNGNVTMYTVNRIGGGTFALPEALVGTGSERTRILSVFTFTDSQTYWTDAVTAWLTNVWGASPPATPPVAVDDPGFDLETGTKTISIPVLANDTNVSSSVNPVVTKQGSETGPVTTSVVSNALQVTSHATNTGAWSQTYRVTTNHGFDDGVASGTVTSIPSPPPSVIFAPHQVGYELAEGGVLVDIATGDDVTTRQGIWSKDASGFGSGGHITFILEGRTISVVHETATQTLVLDVANVIIQKEYELLLVFGPTGTKLYVNRILVAQQSTAWSLQGNTETIALGGDSSHDAAGQSIARDEFEGTIDNWGILTTAEVAELLEGTHPSITSDVDIDVPRSTLVEVDKAAIRANWQRIKLELEQLGGNTSAIDAAKPIDGVSAQQLDMQTNFAATRVQLVALAGSSNLTTGYPALTGNVSKIAVRQMFTTIKTELSALLASPPTLPSPTSQQVGSGVATATSASTNITPAYPSTGWASGDVYYALIGVLADTGHAVTTPANWTSVSSRVQGRLGLYVFRRTTFAEGNADFDWAGSGGTIGCRGFIQRFRGTSSHEGLVTTGGSGATVSFPTVTTTGTNRLCVAFTGINGFDTTQASPTGETGGDWTFRARTGDVGVGLNLVFYLASKPTAGSISGGSITFAAGSSWNVISLALVT